MPSETDEPIRETFDEGPWSTIVRTQRSVTFYPRNRSKQPRFERILASGERLVDDISEGFVLRSEFYAAADLELLKPKGRKIGDRKIMELQQSGREWFVFTFQDRYSSEDERVASDLRLIEHHVGIPLVQEYEVSPGRS